ncbi:MAG: hypothetical protein EOP13_14905 [Pseudomonas sp.]|uniref:3D domain-containing protein n=1 Tax=Pseudomonas sp. TaxID=306 RepID=UPI0011FC0235|nr:3D domain-containing protein [Pseudomonas sp.]RZI72492.1 MAG: hypothetical protein EOP13_14905 [Pseudomonas sp.]
MKNQLFLAVAFLALAGEGMAQTQTDFLLSEPDDTASGKVTLWATHYFIYSAAPSLSGIAFRNKSGEAISDTVAPEDWCRAAIEGTVRVTHGDVTTVLNYGGVGSKQNIDCATVLKIDAKKRWITATGRSYFVPAVGSFGDGDGGYKLVPYRTIAVDRKKIRLGTAIFIPSARGLKFELPSGSTIKHDGYFFAADTGGAIKGNHIDIFCGATAKNCLPTIITSIPEKSFEAFVVDDAEVIEALRSKHK